MGKRDRERKERIRGGLETPFRERVAELAEARQTTPRRPKTEGSPPEEMLCPCCNEPMTWTFVSCTHCEPETHLKADNYYDEPDDGVHTSRCPKCECIFYDGQTVTPAPDCQAGIAEAGRNRELWEMARRAFPDETEEKVIALAEKEGVEWERVPGMNGLRFWYQSADQMEQFRVKMAEIGQEL
jgi:hypothetical protein